MDTRYKTIVISIGLAIGSCMGALAEGPEEGRLSIKASADIGLGSAMSAKSEFQGGSVKSSMSEFGLDVGYTFWSSGPHSLGANVGFRYGSMQLKSAIPDMAYHYSAPATADMDDEPYIRYSEVKNLHQKMSLDRWSFPIYIDYRYRVHRLVSLTALAGVKPGFNGSPKITETSGSAYSYGVYPQYDDLLIDATYMNEFGNRELTAASPERPRVNDASVALLVGVGAEIKICGPLSGAVSFYYERGLSNMFKPMGVRAPDFTAETAPVTYTVAEGQTVRPLCDYLSSSKLSRVSCAISLIYRF